ncbi:MAG: 23S rRNA (adenine(2503)-C(2))-methyltransferase RlmN [Akkermansiaceae bacterium]
MISNSQSLLGLTFSELETALFDAGVLKHHTKALWRGVHRDHVSKFTEIDFSPPLKKWVEAHVGEGKPYFIDSLKQDEEIHSGDGLTRKYLLRLNDGQVIETVLMGYDGRFTACLSSQAGCAMGCVFCATGQMGFVRHLTVGEIVAQVRHVRRMLSQSHPHRRLRNIVLMGMGEPLHNYDAVMKAMDIVSDVRGASIGPSRIAISTVGLVPNILRMAEENRPYRLAVSLHGSTEEERSALVPTSKKWNLESLIAACRSYCETTGKRIFFEWTLIAGKNDSPETAKRLVALLQGLDSHVNIIPLNPTNGFAGAASEAGSEFQKIIRKSGIPCTFRQRRGIDVAAGCGMLKADKLRRG